MSCFCAGLKFSGSGMCANSGITESVIRVIDCIQPKTPTWPIFPTALRKARSQLSKQIGRRQICTHDSIEVAYNNVHMYRLQEILLWIFAASVATLTVNFQKKKIHTGSFRLYIRTFVRNSQFFCQLTIFCPTHPATHINDHFNSRHRKNKHFLSTKH